MKAKILACGLAALLTAGILAAGSPVQAIGMEEASVGTDTSVAVDDTHWIWTRNDRSGLTLPIGTDAAEISLFKDGRLLANSLLDRYLTLNNGQVTIGASLLNQLQDGESGLSLVTKEGTCELTVDVRPTQTEISAEDNTAVSGVSAEPSETEPDKTLLIADQTELTWDRNCEDGLSIMTNSRSRELSAKVGQLFVSSLISRSLSIEDGVVTLKKDFLQRLENGDHTLTLSLKEGTLTVRLHITGDAEPSSDSDKELTAEETNFVWYKSDLLGLTVKTNSTSRTVTLTEGDRTLADDSNIGVYLLAGRVHLPARMLRQLDEGDHTLVLHLEDGTLPITVRVTDRQEAASTAELLFDESFFEWQQGTDVSLVIQTNSQAKSFSIRKEGKLLSNSLLTKTLTIEDGQITLTADFLQQLPIGENHLTLVLQEGSLELTVMVTKGEPLESSSVNSDTLNASETYFTWDRSDLLGISVKTNSTSRHVAITQDGVPLFSNEDLGVYITFGRVGITARHLRQLPDGENHLLLTFDDGTLPVTVNVTDRHHIIHEEVTAERTVFTWRRGSKDVVLIPTNSTSDTAAVRRIGKLALVANEKNITIQNGTITLTPLYLETLDDGRNDLQILLDDGRLTVAVNVIGTAAETSTSSTVSSSIPSKWSGGSGLPIDFPATGGVAVAVGGIVVSGAAGLIGVLAARKKRHKS